MSRPYRSEAQCLRARIRESEARRPSTRLAPILLAVAALELGAAGTACTTHLLGPTDLTALRDSLELEARTYEAIDGGRARAFIRGAYCSDLGVLGRSGVQLEAGPAPIQCGVAP